MDLDSNPTVLMVRKHLVDHLGEPEDVFDISGSSRPGSDLETINLAYFAPRGPDAPVIVATCGVSLHRAPDGRRVEGLVILPRRPSPTELDGVQRLLGSFAMFADASEDGVQLGDVIRAEAQLAPFSAMSSILFVPPFTFLPSFHGIGLSETETIALLWLLPVYPAEAEYALTHGPQTLMLLFSAQALDLTDPRRPAADCAMSPEAAADRAQAVVEASVDRPRPARRPPAGPERSAAIDGRSVTVARRAPARPAQRPAPRPAVRRPTARPKPDADVRFDLDKDGVAPRGRPAPRARPANPEPAPTAAPPATKSKAERVAALKKAAREARVRAKARQDGTAPPPPSTAPAPSSRRSPGRRPAPFRRGGGSSGSEPTS